jgi:hypothetical protein
MSTIKRFKTYAPGDDVGGVLTIPAGEEVVGITAHADVLVSTATVKIGTLRSIPVPPSGTVTITPPLEPRNRPYESDALQESTLRGPLTITFTNTLGWVVGVLY